MMPHDISLNAVKTVEDLLGGEFVHSSPARWKPRCPEAETAIRQGIAGVLCTQTGLYAQNRREVYLEVKLQLAKALRKRYRGGGPHQITHKKFLKHPKRGGWLNIFARR